MSLNYRKFLVIMVIAIILIVAVPNRAHAGLQANKGGTVLTKVEADGFFSSIRRMEGPNGTLGKKASFDDKFLDTTSNGIDSHMILNTEYGTAGILACSEYGNKPTKELDNTTGNESGIYQMGYDKYSFVGGLYKSSSASNASGIKKMWASDERYYNKYNASNVIYKAGDGFKALGAGHDFPSYSTPYLIKRGFGGVLYASSYYAGSADKEYSSRAVVVCGQGL